jgi:hypothetical protein
VSFASSPGDPTPEESWAELSDAWAAAATRHGFAAPGAPSEHLKAPRRRRRVNLLAHSALESVSQIQHYLADADPGVREAARHATRRVMHRCYTGDRSERAWRSTVKPYLADVWLSRRLGTPDPDGPEPGWARPDVQRRTRIRLIVAACFAAAGAAGLLAWHLALLALPLLLVAAALDIADGAYARVVAMRDAELRWLSCIASHFCDILILGAIAAAALDRGKLALGFAVVAAMLVSLAGSFVRVSALQAGYQFWRSRNERIVRYLTMLAYCVLASVHGEVAASVMIVVVLTGFGVGEVARVVRAVLRMPAVRAAGVVFVDRDDELQWWGLADDDVDEDWSLAEVPRQVANLLAH